MSGFREADGEVNQMNNSKHFFSCLNVSAILAKLQLWNLHAYFWDITFYRKQINYCFFPLTDCRLEELKSLTVHSKDLGWLSPTILQTIFMLYKK